MTYMLFRKYSAHSLADWLSKLRRWNFKQCEAENLGGSHKNKVLWLIRDRFEAARARKAV